MKTFFEFISRSKKKPKKLSVEEVRIRSLGEMMEEMREKEERGNMKNKRLTLKDIEEHLRRQDKLAFVPIFAFGCSIFLVAAGLFIQKLSGLDFLMNYLFLLVCGFVLILYASYMMRKSGKESED